MRNFKLKVFSEKKWTIVLLFLVCIPFVSFSQDERDGITINRNNRPDTVTEYHFFDKQVSIALFPNSRPTSNWGFKTKHFKLEWGKVSTKDIDAFAIQCLKGNHYPHKIIDTLTCQMFGKPHTIIVTTSKRRCVLFVYEKGVLKQDVFWITLKRQKFISELISYLNSYVV